MHFALLLQRVEKPVASSTQRFTFLLIFILDKTVIKLKKIKLYSACKLRSHFQRLEIANKHNLVIFDYIYTQQKCTQDNILKLIINLITKQAQCLFLQNRKGQQFISKYSLLNMKSPLQPYSDQFKATNRMVQLGYSSFNAKNYIPYYNQGINQSISSSRKWTINDYYKSYGWSEVFSDMQETNAQEMQAGQSSSNILSDIRHIKFHLLHSIDLNSNHITSIEPMVHMYIPNIVSINLANNFITNINTLAKMNLWKVSNLDMTKNLIKEVPKLHFVNTKGKSAQ